MGAEERAIAATKITKLLEQLHSSIIIRSEIESGGDLTNRHKNERAQTLHRLEG
ncbi:hypothetical protein [Rhodoflexus sp.]